MSGNTFGNLFCVTSFGESHGPAIGCVIDGCPPGLALAGSRHPARSRPPPPGTSRHVTQRHEADAVEILSGVFEGKTTGTPIALLIRNADARSKDYANIARHVPSRPRRLHLLAEVRHPRPARRRPPVGARDRGARGRRRDREEVAARALTASRARPPGADRRDRDPVRDAGTHVTQQSVLRRRRERRAAPRGLHGRAAQVRRLLSARASTSIATRRAGRLGRAGLRQARRRHRLRDDGHQRGEGRRDRRRLRGGRAARHRARRRDDAARASSATTPAASSAASRPGRTSSVSIAVKPTSSIRLAAALDRHGGQRRRSSRRTAATTPASASAPRRSAEAMLALVLMDHALRHRAQCGDVQSRRRKSRPRRPPMSWRACVPRRRPKPGP